MATRLSTSCAVSLFFMLLPMGVFAADDDLAALKAQNDRLAEANIRLAQENADLRAEMTKMKAEFGIGAGITASTKPANIKPASVDPQKTMDANTIICKAFQRYCALVSAIPIDNTDIQKRQKWFDAAKELEGVLAKSRATVTCSISNVSFDPHAQAEVASGKERDLGLKRETGGVSAAKVVVGTAVLKSGDPNIPDVTLDGFAPINIGATEAQAGKITTESSMNLEGTLSLGFDLKKSAADQPAIKQTPGSILVGSIDDPAIHIWSMRPQSLQLNSTASLEIDGTRRKIYGSMKTLPF